MAYLEAEAELYKLRSRKKVYESGNERFVRIEEIVAAEKASRRALKRRKVAKLKDTGPVVEQVEEIIVSGLDRIREIEEM